MPACFQLTSIHTGKPTNFIDIDDEICLALSVPTNPDLYYLGWYDFIGLRLATGKSFTDIKDHLSELWLADDNPITSEWAMQMLRIVDYLSTNYTASNWTEIGRSNG